MKLISTLILIILASTCNTPVEKKTDKKEAIPVQVNTQDGLERAYFSSGCFWCVEEIYESVVGVQEAISGYSGGTTENPTYRNHSDHAEANEIIYDPKIVSFKTLVDVYFASQNIEQVNGQGPDIGESYRSIIFYQNQEQKKIIEDKIAALTNDGFKVAAEVKAFEKFWIAEDYHQDYAKLHPNQGYIQGVSIPRWRKFASKMPDVIKPTVSH
ncbi:peptide-methionine (S)-S-oxide reductase [Nonlabens arenilitoris]|uniref:Peptide methionine sulfoxide reductase MsrA n=1 Tax=Nonlabens arenilitoris TaxID=1217969 RepID=A0A2S7U8H9_9FLAO|nr:peptide-methionine (S)-S-oxide reductase MsrA [Nonlabens arenilitoris]PQJ30867.1 peptide-methionine (S)-S-oxide reductase [Nonlabens arenilitoris]